MHPATVLADVPKDAELYYTEAFGPLGVVETFADDLLAHCETMLARYKLPRRIEFTDAMPRDPNGKLYKRTLRDPYWVGRERAI